MKDVNKAIALASEYTDAYTTRGRIFYAQGDNHRAIVDLSTSIGLDRKQTRPYGMRVRIWCYWKEQKRAMDDAEELIRLDPKNYYSYLTRGYVQADMGKFEPALADLEEARKLNEKAADVYKEKAFCLAGQKKYRRSHRRSVDRDSTGAKFRRSPYHPKRAGSEVATGPRHCRPLPRFKFQRPRSAGLARARTRLLPAKPIQESAADFDAVLKIQPDSFEARLRRADAYKVLGEIAKAKADLAQLGKTKPDDPGAYLRRGMAFEAEGQFDAALADADKAMEDAALAPAAFRLFEPTPTSAKENWRPP